MSKKQFQVKDHSGRGASVTLTADEIRERFDANYKNDPSGEFEDTLGEWLEVAELDDRFDNEDDHVSFTRIR